MLSKTIILPSFNERNLHEISAFVLQVCNQSSFSVPGSVFQLYFSFNRTCSNKIIHRNNYFQYFELWNHQKFISSRNFIDFYDHFLCLHSFHFENVQVAYTYEISVLNTRAYAHDFFSILS